MLNDKKERLSELNQGLAYGNLAIEGVILVLTTAALVEHLVRIWGGNCGRCCFSKGRNSNNEEAIAEIPTHRMFSIKGIVCLIVKCILPVWVLVTLLEDLGDQLAYAAGAFSPPYDYGLVWLLDFAEVLSYFSLFSIGCLFAFFWDYLLDLMLGINLHRSATTMLKDWGAFLCLAFLLLLVLMICQAAIPVRNDLFYLIRNGLYLLYFLLLDLTFLHLVLRLRRAVSRFGDAATGFARRLFVISAVCLVLYTLIAVESIVAYFVSLDLSPQFTTYWVVRNIVLLDIPVLFFLYSVSGKNTIVRCTCAPSHPAASATALNSAPCSPTHLQLDAPSLPLLGVPLRVQSV